MIGFLLRLGMLQLATAAGSVVANAIVQASPHWGPPPDASSWSVPSDFVMVVGLPGSLILAATCHTRPRLAAAAGAVVGILAFCGTAVAVDTSSTASLVFLWFPVAEFGLVGAALALRAEDRRRANARGTRYSAATATTGDGGGDAPSDPANGR